MEKSNFISLLEKYKQAALEALRKEAKVSAALILPESMKEKAEQFTKMSLVLSDMYDSLEKDYENLHKQSFPGGYASFPLGYVSTTDAANALLNSITGKFYESDEFKAKKREIINKFDLAIHQAKITKSAAKLNEMAKLFGIETEDITVDTKPSGVDGEFIKEKIKSVLLLT